MKMTHTVAEQPADWTERGVFPVAPGLYRMPLPLPLVGLPAVNVYVLEGPDGLILIDAGWASQEAYDRLGQGLAELGHRLGDIDTFVITHAHWDHYSLASRVRQDHPQVGLVVGRGERETIEGYTSEIGIHGGQSAQLRRHGAAEIADRVDAKDREAYERDVPFDAPSRYLAEGDRLPLADGSLQIEETPGHTKGHLTVRWPAAGMLFTGDHVLPNATPALAMELVPDEHPLRTYLDSLRRTRADPDALMLPAHGPIGGSVHARTEELLAHHAERLTEIEHLVAGGSRTALEMARALPWTKRERKLDDLDVVHQMSAVMEVVAHLLVLQDEGRVRSQTDGDFPRWVPAR
ncbi:MBL fold metallo-hydrolase [Granulicoccus phenolivorans]|uniref:MBL fold metallo-hydrolase n=1 Tax=Granulicoccus phenolivorans TaxID=266854 RepID=UPI0004116E2B|nr:MBL fold metallo-hydrolase [Granulicoccus phenolivorans]